MDKIAKKENFIQKYSVPNSIEKFKKIKTSIDASKSNSKCLSTLKKENGEKNVRALIKMWLVSLNDFVNTSRKMSPEQIDEISLYIFQDYYYLTVADIYLLITDIKKGRYGQLYESLDGIKILSFFEKYANERAMTIYENGLREHDNIKHNANST